MNAESSLFPAQPYLGTDVVAFVLAAMACVFAILWRRDREPGMGWFTLSMALLAAWAGLNRLHMPTGPYLIASPWFYLMIPAGATLTMGLVGHLRLEHPWRRPAIWASLLPMVLYLALVVWVALTGAQLLRVRANLLIGASMFAMAWLVWQEGRRQPQEEYGWLALSLCGLPVISGSLAAFRIDPVALRYWGVLPVFLVAVTLMTVTLRRRRRAVQAEMARRIEAESALTRLNASLEQSVAQRTSDLQELVSGLESFNRSVSHDLRGSLGGIAGLARLADEALNRGDPTLAKRALPAIAEQADSAHRLTQALLSLAKVGEAELRRTPVDLRRLVQQIADQLALEQGSLAMPRIELGELPTVNADPELLKPIFVNLIGNAIKFSRTTEQPRVEIGAEAGSGAKAGPLTVYVRDNGVGFEAAAAERLFDPFARLHGKQFDGHGVGLSIVRRAVERHGGRVWAEGCPGQGATFRFTLPA